jgi:hypothetical protein
VPSRRASLRTFGCLVALLAVAGCGQQSPEEHSAGRAPTAAVVSPVATPAAHQRKTQRRPNGAGATRAVRAYYDDLDAQQFDTAWTRLTPKAQAELGGYGDWHAGFENTVSTTLTAATTAESDAHSATVEVELRSVDLDACTDDVAQRFAGTWRLTYSSGRWLGEDLRLQKVAGRDPVTSTSDCPGAVAVTPPDNYDGPAPSEPAPSSVPSYPADPSNFCDTHDCIPNYPNGTGTTTQCSDGTYSHSGGRSGACSYHGGLAPKRAEPVDARR